MTLPPLKNWEATRDSLHQAAQVLSVIKKACIAPQPNALHLSMRIVPEGLSTGALSIGTFTLNYGTGAIDYYSFPDSQPSHVPLSHHNPRLLPMQLMQEVAKARPDQTLRVLPKASDLTTPFMIDPQIGAEYASVQYTVFTALARFRARVTGLMTPLVVWPHGFDLSMLWFPPGGSGSPDEQTVPHLNFGFSPFSAGFPRPYLYVYAWPTPKNLNNKLLPSPAKWHNGSWTGVVVDYDALRVSMKAETPPAFKIETLYERIFSVLSEVLPKSAAAAAEAMETATTDAATEAATEANDATATTTALSAAVETTEIEQVEIEQSEAKAPTLATKKVETEADDEVKSPDEV